MMTSIIIFNYVIGIALAIEAMRVENRAERLWLFFGSLIFGGIWVILVLTLWFILIILQAVVGWIEDRWRDLWR